MVVTRSMSGTTKRADTQVAVNHKVAKRASKKTTAEGERASKNLRVKEKRLTVKEIYMIEACDLFIKETFQPQFLEKHPKGLYTIEKESEIWNAGTEEWDSMTDSDKAPYVAAIEKKWADQMAQTERYRKEPRPNFRLVWYD